MNGKAKASEHLPFMSTHWDQSPTSKQGLDGISGIRELTKTLCRIRENARFLIGIRDFTATREAGFAKNFGTGCGIMCLFVGNQDIVRFGVNQARVKCCPSFKIRSRLPIQTKLTMLGPAVHRGKDTIHNTLETICNARAWRKGRAVQTDPTLLCYASATTEQKKCWELLAQKFDWFQTLRNNSQQHTATCNNMQQQGVQTDATCNIQQCWKLLGQQSCVRLHGA